MIDYSMIFVGGTGRSGTTILGEIIAADERVLATQQEVRFITDPGGLLDLYNGLLVPDFALNDRAIQQFEALYMSAIKGGIFWSLLRFLLSKVGISSLRYRNLRFERAVRDSLKKLLRDFYSDLGVKYVNGIWYGSPSFRYSKIYYITNHDEAFIREKVQKFIYGFFTLTSEQNINSHRYFLDDSPTSVLHYKQLNNLFPNSKFVIARRKSANVVNSFKKQTWGNRRTEEDTVKCVQNIDVFITKIVVGENVHFVNYDNLVSRQKQISELNKLSDFLSIPVTEIGKMKLKMNED